MRILLVEDDEILGDGIKKGLSLNPGFIVDWLKDGASAIHALESELFDVVLLDIGLPGRSGLEVVQALRNSGKKVPVIMITARDTVADRIIGLDAGADDYIVKPFDMNELSARVRALKRRSINRFENVLTYGNISLDVGAHEVRMGNEILNLPRREFSLLQKFLENVGQALSRDQLTQTLYGWEEEIDSNTLEVHVHNLRKKLNLSTIRTIRGVGYMLEKLKDNE